MLVTAWWSLRPEIPPEVQEQIEDDLEKCGGELKEARCAVSGEDGWIFLQESLVNLVVDWKENLNSFVAFNDSLEARGIKLVVVPVPDKLQIEAEHYSEELSGGIVARNMRNGWTLCKTKALSLSMR